MLSSDKRLELQELLETHQNTECTDIRDKVFGFLGLTSAPGQPPIFLADYSKSVNEVYDQTLRYLYLCSRGSDGRLLNPSLFRKFAVLLQHSLKLSHLEDLAEDKITRILAEIGEEHPTLTSMANLTSTYRNQGRWKEVEELEVQVMETRGLMASPANSIPDTQLGLTQSEIQLLRWHQALVLSQAGNSSSRAASNASSQGRLLLDPSSLQALSTHFNCLMYSIQQRWQTVSI